MKHITTLTILFFAALQLAAQGPSSYGRTIVKYLSSEEYAGRGYTHNGLEKSAEFIKNEFKKIGLKKFDNSYYQPLSYPINVVENSQLTINGKVLQLGNDYIVSPFSKTDAATYQTQTFNTSIIDSVYQYHDMSFFHAEIERLKGKMVVFPTVDFPPNYTLDGISANELYREIKFAIINQQIGDDIKGGIEIVPDKLTMSLANEQKNTHLFTVLESSISTPITEISFKVESTFKPEFKTQNVLGYIPGKDTSKKVLITAHYDHLGKIGDIYFPGANDNASGVAMMLAMAKYFKQNKPKYTLVFIAFTGEEAGLKGSEYFVNHPSFNLSDIKLVCNFDIVGTGEEGIQIVNSAKNIEVFTRLNQINDKHQILKNIKKRGEACNSDHCMFDQKGIPAIFTYTLGGVSYYHDVNDKEETLSLAEFNDVFFLFKSYFETYID